jgi:hypothetical protein
MKRKAFLTVLMAVLIPAMSVQGKITRKVIDDGGSGAYKAVALEEKTFPDAFLGSSARAGLCLTKEPDHITDLYVDLSGVGIWLNGEPADVDAVDSWDRHESAGGPSERFASLYADYYHGDYATLEFVNPAAQSQDGLMILASSHTNCLERFFTANFGYVCKVDGRATDLKADDVVAMHPEITAVLIIGHDALGVLATLA